MNTFAVSVVLENPLKPPTQFKYEADLKTPRMWRADVPLISEYFKESPSSSSCFGALDNLPLNWLKPPTNTASWISIFELYFDILLALERTSSVKVEDGPENLFELRRLTGFTWARLAKLLNVNRRTLHNWVSGANIRKKNREHIAKTLKVLRYFDRGSAELNATALNEQHVQHGVSLFEEIQIGNYEVVTQQLSYGPSLPQRRPMATNVSTWFGEFQPMLIHEDADGTEMIEPLPDQIEPASRKRSIRHV